MKHAHLYLLIAFCLNSVVPAAEPFHFAENDQKQLTLTEGTLPILTYQFDAIEHENVPPRDRRRTAGCYVHPLHGLNGEILTDNAPADHYHHHGVFWTWPHVGVHEPDGSTTHYDLWTSDTALKQHFVRWIDRTISDESATFAVENGWFVGDPQNGNKIMTERVKIIVHRIQTVGDVRSRAVDFEFRWQPTDKPITLRGSAGKSYGGFTVRFRPVVPDGKSLAEPSEVNKITVPSGIAPGDLEETPLAWAGYTSAFGSLDGEKRLSGAVIFVPPTHPNFPPTWLTRYYGPLCVGWPGVDGRTFQPGEKIKLRYRIWIHDGAVTLPQIEKAYGEYVR
ncbi:MAG: PmoA family protein [Planctomycetaceae bacterium]|nr:PmoA family protein [Planctomycetaceae bacterium]